MSNAAVKMAVFIFLSNESSIVIVLLRFALENLQRINEDYLTVTMFFIFLSDFPAFRLQWNSGGLTGVASTRVLANNDDKLCSASDKLGH